MGAGRGVKKQKAEDASKEVRKGTAEPVPDAEPQAAAAPEGQTAGAIGTMSMPSLLRFFICFLHISCIMPITPIQLYSCRCMQAVYDRENTV